jgi:hypothetical protein
MSKLPEKILKANKKDLLAHLAKAREDLGTSRAVIDRLKQEKEELISHNRRLEEVVHRCDRLEEQLQGVRARSLPRIESGLGTYDGSTDWEEYFKQFSIVSRVNGWTDTQKMGILIAKLRGNALTAISGLDERECMDFKSLAHALSINFSPGDHYALYSDLMRQRRQAEGESLDAVFRDIQKWVTLAYPGADKFTRDNISVEHFTNAIQDSSVRVHLRRSVPKDLNDALKAAKHLTAIESIEGHRKSMGSDKASAAVAVCDEMVKVAPAQSISTPNVISSIEALSRDVRELKVQLQQLTANNQFRGGSNSTYRQGVTCWNCGEVGHRRFECPHGSPLNEQGRTTNGQWSGQRN